MNAPHYSPAINLGQIITVVAFIASAGSTVGYLSWTQSAFQTSTELRLAVGEAVREKYVPTIDAMRQTLDITNERLSVTAKALAEQRDATRDLAEKVAGVRERLVAIETALGLRPTGRKTDREPTPR